MTSHFEVGRNVYPLVWLCIMFLFSWIELFPFGIISPPLRASCYKIYALLIKILENYLYISLSFPFNSNEEILMGAVFFLKFLFIVRNLLVMTSLLYTYTYTQYSPYPPPLPFSVLNRLWIKFRNPLMTAYMKINITICLSFSTIYYEKIITCCLLKLSY